MSSAVISISGDAEQTDAELDLYFPLPHARLVMKCGGFLTQKAEVIIIFFSLNIILASARFLLV